MPKQEPTRGGVYPRLLLFSSPRAGINPTPTFGSTSGRPSVRPDDASIAGQSLSTLIPKFGHVVFSPSVCSARQNSYGQGPFRHSGEGRNPIPLIAGFLDPGLRRGDNFGSVFVLSAVSRLHRIRDRISETQYVSWLECSTASGCTQPRTRPQRLRKPNRAGSEFRIVRRHCQSMARYERNRRHRIALGPPDSAAKNRLHRCGK